jgi:PAS domain S-box-containing protein
VRVAANSNIPSVVLTDFLTFNQSKDLASLPWRVAEISVGYRDSVIAFDFAALDYTAPNKNRFQYMLEGFDAQWIDAKTNHYASYTNLDPGRYVFRARGSNNDGLWNLEGLRVGLYVPPPPWRSWWAHLLYAAAAGALLLAGVVSLERRRRRARELERINVSLQSEIEIRMEKEEALEAERRKAREYLDVAEVLMVALDGEGRVQLVNQKGCRVLGYEEAEIVGADWLSKFVPIERHDEVAGILARIEDHAYCEYPVMTRTGEERVIAWHSTQLPSLTGDRATLISGTDNTEVRALEKQVRMRQKMDALGTMAGGIAHDFNNILTAILGYSTLTLSHVAPGSEEAGYLKYVVQGCERARDMVARILAFSRREETNKKPVEIGPVILEVCSLLRSSLPVTIEIKTSIDPELEPVIADATQIHQVLMNLGTNSWHAMPEGGVLEIIAQPVEMAPAAGALDGELQRGRYVELTVRDTGHGMDKATLERVFDPFFTTKQVGVGTGLGLSVAHGIVKAHLGEISIRSAPGRGTSVRVLLPCAERAPVSAGAEQLATGAGSERILLVDDETPIVLLAKKWLEERGYEVEPHTDAVDALAAFRAKPRRFDMLITDQKMPEMEGLELVGQVRLLKPGLPVVMTSGRRFRRESEEAGCVWLQKPFGAVDLAASVRAALDARRSGLRSIS